MPSPAHTRLLKDMYDKPFLYGLRYDRSKDKPDLIFLDKAYHHIFTITLNGHFIKDIALCGQLIDKEEGKLLLKDWGWVAVSSQGQLVTKRDSTARRYSNQLLDALLDLYGDPAVTKHDLFDDRTLEEIEAEANLPF